MVLFLLDSISNLWNRSSLRTCRGELFVSKVITLQGHDGPEQVRSTNIFIESAKRRMEESFLNRQSISMLVTCFFACGNLIGG